jgi:hypothetical protein
LALDACGHSGGGVPLRNATGTGNGDVSGDGVVTVALDVASGTGIQLLGIRARRGITSHNAGAEGDGRTPVTMHNGENEGEGGGKHIFRHRHGEYIIYILWKSVFTSIVFSVESVLVLGVLLAKNAKNKRKTKVKTKQ